jgi:hypothetical protein
MIPRLYELDTVNASIRENHRDAMRAEQARIAMGDRPSGRPRSMSLARPLATFIERVRRTRIVLPRRAPHPG